jgi:hypothetical protein
MTAPTDSFAAVVAELREYCKPGRIADVEEIADRIERLDAEMREERDITKKLLLNAMLGGGQIMDRLVAERSTHADELAELRARLAASEKDGHNVCEALVEGYRAEWTMMVGCRCGGCRTFKLRDWNDAIVMEHEDQRDFLNAIASLASRPSPGAMGGEEKPAPSK